MERNLETNLITINNEKSIYRHFKKGDWYQVITVASHHETGDSFVVYRAMYGEKKVYIRELESFMSETELDKYPMSEQKFRFMNMDDFKYENGGMVPDLFFDGLF